LNVSAKDKGTGKEASVQIKQSSGLSESEIEKMRKDAEAHAADDKRRVDLASARNEAEHQCYALEKMIKEQGEKLKPQDKEPIEQAIVKVRETAKGDSPETIKAAVNELEQVAQAFAKQLYSQAGATGEGAPTSDAPEASSSKPGDDAIDAEFEVK
ncbi:MAG TPA: Hsp70 family protein, partial [Pirellulaceae bacterium]|nr:Hsp70 family protein [Pirellulaceae bacterium]